MKGIMKKINGFAMAIFCLFITAGQSGYSLELENGFLSPPNSSKPWVLWYWMDGQIDRDGITRDLESMARQGIGGAVLGDITHREASDAVRFLTPEWQELFGHTMREAKRLGMTISTCPSAGWCAGAGRSS